MNDNPHDSAVEQSAEAPPEHPPEADEVRPRSPTVQHVDSFSLSSLFLLMVTFAALLGFAINALPGRTVVSDEMLQVRTSERDTGFLWFASGVLAIVSITIGGVTGYRVKRRFSTMLIGIFYSMVITAVPAAALFQPPSWKIVLFCCGMLVVIGAILGAQPRRKPEDDTVSSGEASEQ